MNNNQPNSGDRALKSARETAVKHLQNRGFNITNRIPTRALLEKINLNSGTHAHADCENSLAVIEQFNAKEKADDTGMLKKATRIINVAKPRTPTKFREWQPVAHPRQADIDALPHQITISNAGYRPHMNERSKK